MIKGKEVKLIYAGIALFLFLLGCVQVQRGVVEFNIVAILPLLISLGLIVSYFWERLKK